MKHEIDELKSGIQKYIRRSNVDKALMSCRDLLDQGRGLDLARRLLIISGEDISIGDPLVVITVWKYLAGISNWSKCDWTISRLIPNMCRAEKTREFAHIYYAVYADDSVEPTKSLNECLENKDIELVRWLKFIDKDTILQEIAKRDNTFEELVSLALKLTPRVKENIWIYGFVVLMYLYEIPIPATELYLKIPEMPVDLLELDDYVLDKHTKRGRALGRDLKYFVHVGAIVIPESKYTTLKYKEIHDQMYG